MLHLNDHLYTKLMCLFVGIEFLVSHCRLRTPRHFYGLSPLELCLTTPTGLSPKGLVDRILYIYIYIYIYIYRERERERERDQIPGTLTKGLLFTPQ